MPNLAVDHASAAYDQLSDLNRRQRRLVDQIGASHTGLTVPHVRSDADRLMDDGIAILDNGFLTLTQSAHIAWCQLCSEPAWVNEGAVADRRLVVRADDGWEVVERLREGDDFFDKFWVHAEDDVSAISLAQAYLAEELAAIQEEYGEEVESGPEVML